MPSFFHSVGHTVLPVEIDSCSSAVGTARGFAFFATRRNATIKFRAILFYYFNTFSMLNPIKDLSYAVIKFAQLFSQTGRPIRCSIETAGLPLFNALVRKKRLFVCFYVCSLITRERAVRFRPNFQGSSRAPGIVLGAKIGGSWVNATW